MSDLPITRTTMFEPLLEADPSFLPLWQAFLEDWCDEPELPQYLALGDLARHLVDRLARGDLAGLDKVFVVVELWHTEGDAYVRQAATIGLLEGLLGGEAHFEACRRGNDPPLSPVEPWLLPESKKWWDRLRRFWNGDVLALRDNT